ncbi:lamin tail domain-containing protein [Flavihumibacter fluvii]|uniref:lamin tail domain-containing protein n=1 Tax=Flavihumibacter fluvii TaxID=2838157 RepID=UPI001BDEB12F|nr:lamin tail domain-containing protein [Flavihumibacter fluvii]ULQ51374.1 lamin tail domain-containing protein [Flavihumibacter fluvii]
MLRKCLLTIVLFSAVTLSAQAFQVAITELMPDPEPAISLPPEEFIELTNVSGKPIDISGWQLSNGRTTARLPDSVFLAADSILIICSSRSADQFARFGSTLGVTHFPALSNEDDTIVLTNLTGLVIHAVAYSGKWYSREWPSGGRSLEMIQLQNSCSQQNNWGPSKAITGGTPGQANSLASEPTEGHRFTLLYAFCKTDSAVVLVFDDAIDAGSISLPGAIQTDPAVQFNSMHIEGQLHNQLVCTLAKPLVPHQLIEISADGITSCLHQPTGGIRRVKVGLPDPDPEKLVINEILFDPPIDGADYMEFYNASDKVTNLQDLQVANRNSSREIAGKKTISAGPRYIFPGEYIAITTDPDWLSRQYLVKDPAKIVTVEALPAWPNERGNVLLLTTDNSILDELMYAADWHFELLRNKEGVALERKDPGATTQDPSNWLSAATHAGYGTPGYSNSQFMALAGTAQNIWLEPELFTPNSDGLDDVCKISYRFDQSGFVLTTKIFDRSGMLVRTLVNNGLCGLQGFFPWDGKDDKKKQLPPNVYIVVTELFSIAGKTMRFRHAVTMGY